MTPERFYSVRKGDWERLTILLDRSKNQVAQLGPSEVEEIGRLYRTVTSDLAVAQREFPGHDVSHYLNQLTAQAHATLYRGAPVGMRQIRRFFTHVIPQTFRETLRFTIVAALLFFLPAIIAGVVTTLYPETARVMLSPQMHGILTLIEENDAWFEFDTSDSPETASFITTNNIQVSILAFAGGLTAGLFTIYVMILNGLMLGSITGYSTNHDFALRLWNFVIGHGVIELSMICVAGGAGLMFAWAIIHPTPYKRTDALYQAGRKAIVLLITGAIFLVVAGIIEGFISPRTDLPAIVKWLVGFGSGGLMFAYLFLAGREGQLTISSE